ncbi:MAG: TolC family protein [Proteobacteria bacterium]|nr:TolC family protein [Pseudomonadota bacterium]
MRTRQLRDSQRSSGPRETSQRGWVREQRIAGNDAVIIDDSRFQQRMLNSYQVSFLCGTHMKLSMPNIIATAALFFGTLLTARSSFAITWDELRQFALSGNPNLRSADIEIERTETTIKAAKGGYYPSVKAAYSKTRAIDPEPYGASTSNRLSVSASQNLFAGFADLNLVEKAESFMSSQTAAKASISCEQRLALRKAFNGGLYLQDGKHFAKKTLDRRRENVRIVNLRYEGGRENKSSALKTEASRLSAEADLNFYLGSLKVIHSQISRLIGKDLPEGEIFQGQLDQNILRPSVREFTQHPKMIQAEADLRASQANINASRSGWLPILTADAAAYRSGGDQSLEASPHYSIGLTLTVPIFTPSQSPRYRDAVLEREKNDLHVSDVQNTLKLDFEKGQVALEDAKARAQVAAKMVEATEMQAQVYRQRYTLGMVSFQDWDTAESEYIKAEKDLLNARHDLADARADLDLTQGLGLKEDDI